MKSFLKISPPIVAGSFSGVAGLATMLLGALVLLGWAGYVAVLKSVIPRGVAMSVDSACCFLLAGGSLWLQREEGGARGRLWAARLAAGLLGVIAIGNLVGLGIGARGRNEAGAAGADMSVATAVGFLLVGAALLSLNRVTRGGYRPAFALVLLSAVIGLVDAGGYLYGVSSLEVLKPFSTMAVHTAVGFLVLAVGILASRRGPGVFQILTDAGLGGRLTRRLLPFAVGVPLALGWLLLEGQRAGLYGQEFGLALFATGNALIFSVIIVRGAVWLNRVDAVTGDHDRRHRELIEALPQLVWTCRADGTCDYLSPQWVRYTGVPEALQLPSGWLDRIHADDRASFDAQWAGARERGQPMEMELRLRRHDGVDRWFRTRAEPMRDAAGTVVKWFGTNTDVDDRKRSEATARVAFREVNDFKAALDEHAIVAVTDARGKITFVNDKFCAISKYAREELLDQDHRLINSGFHAKSFISELWSTIAEGRVWHGQIKNRAKDGTYYWVDTTVVPFRNEDGQLRQYVAIGADITAFKSVEAEVRQSRDKMERQVDARTAELQQLNQALRENSAMLAEAQRIARVGSWSLDVVTGEVYWSEELFRIVGLDPANTAPNYQDQEGMFKPESWSRLTKAIEQTLATGMGYELQLEAIRPDGEHRWTIARGEVTQIEEGVIKQLSGTFQDLTELTQTRIELERLSERMQLATQAGDLGIWDWLIPENELIWDETMFALYGVDPAKFSSVYDAWRATVHPDDLAATEAALNAAVGGERDFDLTFRVVRPDGVVRQMKGVSVVYRDESGKALRMVGINVDITEEVEMAQALRDNEALLREFVAHAPAAIAMLDTELRYLQVSDRWLADYKLRSDIIGRVYDQNLPHVPERWKDRHQRVLAGEVDRCAEEPVRRADGEVDWLQWEARPWLHADGRVGGVILFTQFITERKTMELELREQKKLLERSNHDLEQFAYVASHDLQEPLRAVTGCVQILRRRYAGKFDDSADELIGHIVDGAGRMQTLIHDLLAYSRVGTQGKDLAVCASADAFHRAIGNLRTAITESGASVTAGELPAVKADPAQLAQLFQNLIGNALKYRSSRTPEIRVEAVQEDGAHKFSVRDNGIGIEPQYFARIFALFQRLHTRGEYSGTGIGLALCEKIVARHGGRIWLESKPGQGSVFYFTLPNE